MDSSEQMALKAIKIIIASGKLKTVEKINAIDAILVAYEGSFKK